MFKWLTESNRYKHLIGGCIIGLGSKDLYCATYAGFGIAGALEFKDKLHGGKFDFIDFIITVIGVYIGFGIRYKIFG